ncbi:MAG: hypothetical protein EXR50_06340, partial [Dehalococcoidia bacterium]|nr:hypothetical protein [Dehalococcoidia bacterium]
EMIAPRRIRLHQQVARALESQYANRLEEHAVELAEHFSYSSDPTDLAKAVHYGEMAARRAVAVYAYSEAVGHLERCLQVQEVLDPDDKAKRCDLLLALAEALMPAGQPIRAVEEGCEQALALAEVLGDQMQASRACRLALEGLLRYGSGAIWGSRTFAKWAEQADGHALPNTPDRVHADLAMGNAKFSAGLLNEAATLRDRAMELARVLDSQEPLFLAATPRIGHAHTSPQRQGERLRLADEFTQRVHDEVSVQTLGYLLWLSTHTYLDWGEREQAEEMLRRLTELSSRTRDPEPLLRALRVEVTLLTLDGNLEAALEAGERMVAHANQLGAPGSGLTSRNAVEFRPLLYVGRGDEALSILDQGNPAAGAQEGPVIRGRRAICLAYLGRMAEAQTLLHLMITQLELDPGEDEVPTGVLVSLLETAALVEDKEAAALLAHKLSGVASLLTAPEHTCIARHLGEAAALLGDKEKAGAYYQQALEVCAKLRHRPEAALTHLQLAELLLEEADDVGAGSPRPDHPVRGDLAPTGIQLRHEAMEHLDFAIAEFTEMKMQPSLERALRHKGLLKA